MNLAIATVFAAGLVLAAGVHAENRAPGPSASVYDAALAKRLGADEHGMRRYVLVILKTGPKRMPEGKERDAMFARGGKLAVAGPFSDDPAGWRGLFVFAVDDMDEARRLTETDPVIRNGEMVAEYHSWYGSAATMMVAELHEKLTPKTP